MAETNEEIIIYPIDKRSSQIINIAKFICIILVLYGHSYRKAVSYFDSSINFDISFLFEFFQNIISRIIDPVCISVFFFLSAVLMYRKKFTWKENIKKKTSTLVIPYIIFNTLGILTYWVFQKYHFNDNLFPYPTDIISNWNFYDWLNAYIGYRFGYPRLFPLWFLRNLIVLNIFCCVIKYLIDKFNIKFLYVIGILYFIVTYFSFNRNFTEMGFMSLFYWSLGYYFVKNQISFDDIAKAVKKYHLLFVYTILAIICHFLSYINIEKIYLLKSIFAIIGCCCLIAVSCDLVKSGVKNLLLKLSQYTFAIYFLHEFNLYFFKETIADFLPDTTKYIALEYIFCPIIIMIYCIFLTVLIKKFCPKIYGILFGYR